MEVTINEVDAAVVLDIQANCNKNGFKHTFGSTDSSVKIPGGSTDNSMKIPGSSTNGDTQAQDGNTESDTQALVGDNKIENDSQTGGSTLNDAHTIEVIHSDAAVIMHQRQFNFM